MAQAFDLLRQADSETPVSPTGSEDFSTFTNVILGCFVFAKGANPNDGRPDLNHHRRFNLFQSCWLPVSGRRSRLCSMCSVLVGPEMADRKGGHLD